MAENGDRVREESQRPESVAIRQGVGAIGASPRGDLALLRLLSPRVSGTSARSARRDRRRDDAVHGHAARPHQQPSRALALATMILVPSAFSQRTVTSARVWPPSTRRPVMIPRVVKGSFGHSTLVNFTSRRPPR